MDVTQVVGAVLIFAGGVIGTLATRKKNTDESAIKAVKFSFAILQQENQRLSKKNAELEEEVETLRTRMNTFMDELMEMKKRISDLKIKLEQK